MAKKRKSLEKLYISILHSKIEIFAIECDMTFEEVIKELLLMMNQRKRKVNMNIKVNTNNQVYVTINGKDFALPNEYINLDDISILRRLKKDAPVTQKMILKELKIID